MIEYDTIYSNIIIIKNITMKQWSRFNLFVTL